MTDAALGPGKPSVTKHKIKSRERCPSRPGVAASSVDEVSDRLKGLLLDDALQEALAGLGPEQISTRGAGRCRCAVATWPASRDRHGPLGLGAAAALARRPP
jgi:hypothetical protein